MEETKIIDNEIVTTTKIDLATFLAQKKEYLEQLEREEYDIRTRKENIIKELEALLPKEVLQEESIVIEEDKLEEITK